MSPVFTVGHSTRGIEQFIALLQENNIQLLIDVRRYPGSRRHPHFNESNLEQSLFDIDIEYRHIEVLGGRRGKPAKDSVNDGWRSNGFQAYADYINTADVQKIIDELVKLAQTTTYALMCAEAVYWKCHRQLIADALTARNIDVLHILGPSRVKDHSLNDMAHILDDGRVIYPSKQQKLFGD